MKEKKETTKKKRGRPAVYTDELAVKICTKIADGQSLRNICKDEKMPTRRTIYLWLLDERKKIFLHQYNIANDIRAENMFDSLIEIADLPDKKESFNRSRLRVDTRKWYLSKLLPKKFGSTLGLTPGGIIFSQPSKEEKEEINIALKEIK